MRRGAVSWLIPMALAALAGTARLSAGEQVPYDTLTGGITHRWASTQTAYVPVASVAPPDGMSSPQDLAVDGRDTVWIADTGNARVLSFDPATGAWREWGRGALQGPTGVFTGGDGRVYVADLAAEQVVVFGPDGRVEARLGRPASPLFGTLSPWKPFKVAADRLGTISVISQGSTSGVVQLTRQGDFLGYFGVNPTRLTLAQLAERLFFTQAQKSRLLSNLPPSPDNIAIDQDGILYTSTFGVETEAIRRLNVGGANMLPGISWYPRFIDLAVDRDGNIFGLADDGWIMETDAQGHPLFAFGGNDPSSVRLGLTRSPAGIGVDSSGSLYVLDKDLGTVTAFRQTEFARTVHQGISLYRRGLYAQSQGPWAEALRMNGSFRLAHQAIGRALYQRQRYADALAEFSVGRDRAGWSQAFWEIRNAWLQARLGAILLLLVLVPVAAAVLRRLDRKGNLFRWARTLTAAARGVKLLADVGFLGRFLRHPVDSFYALRREGRGTVLSATIVWALLAAVNVGSAFAASFLFSDVTPGTYSLGAGLVTLLVPFAAWVTANYLVSAISDGEGRLRDVYVGTAYALAPYILFMLPLALLTRVLTLNESFLWSFGRTVLYTWSALNLFLMVKEVHGYRIGESVRTVLVTFFAMAIMGLAAVVLYVLVDQVRDFVFAIVQEARLRA